MKILVCGAGVQGCALCHILRRGNHSVTLLARGAWRENLENNGLIIRHFLQRKTTVDLIRVIGGLDRNDIYDMIFIAVQAGQLPKILPIVAANRSHRVMIFGNNIRAAETAVLVAGNREPRQIGFGWLNVGGRRDKNNCRVVSVHNGIRATMGGSDHALPPSYQRLLTLAFRGSGCRLVWDENMDAWLKTRLALTLPIAYAALAAHSRFMPSSAEQRRTIIGAVQEGCRLLDQTGHAHPSGKEYLSNRGRHKLSAELFLLTGTPFGRLITGDYCARVVAELALLDGGWRELREMCPGYAMPAWDELRSAMPPWDALIEEAAGAAR